MQILYVPNHPYRVITDCFAQFFPRRNLLTLHDS